MLNREQLDKKILANQANLAMKNPSLRVTKFQSKFCSVGSLEVMSDQIVMAILQTFICCAFALAFLVYVVKFLK
jgi:hypothetical protein